LGAGFGCDAGGARNSQEAKSGFKSGAAGGEFIVHQKILPDMYIVSFIWGEIMSCKEKQVSLCKKRP
jgi:hypothetical protein